MIRPFVLGLASVMMPLTFSADFETCKKKKSKECKQFFRNKIKNHPAWKLPYWKKYMSKPVAERIYVADQKLVEMIHLQNLHADYPEVPSKSNVTDSFIREVKQAFAEIPKSAREHLKTRFAGVYLMKGFGGTGITDYIYDENDNIKYAYVVLDSEVLKKRTANEWATWKESTPFKADPRYRIEAIIEDKKNNNRKNAIQYILIHELAHVASANSDFHPPWNPEYMKKMYKKGKYPFFDLSWRLSRDKTKFFAKDSFFEQKNVVYYWGAKLEMKDAFRVYSEIEKRDFPTLYAVTHFGDDFAESYVTYIHSVLMKKPFAVNIYKDDKLLKSFKLCWGTPRCAKKEKLLKKYFNTI
jgi:predicted metallopeptidase